MAQFPPCNDIKVPLLLLRKQFSLLPGGPNSFQGHVFLALLMQKEGDVPLKRRFPLTVIFAREDY